MSRAVGSKNGNNRTLKVTSYGTVTEMANDVRTVLKSIIHQDGRYSTKEAGVVGKLYGAELTRMNLQVDIHKINAKITSKKSTASEILSLND